MNKSINLDLARQVVEIAQLASVEILKIYHSQELNTQQKSDDSPVTAADLAANEVINKGLNALAVKFPIVSEENAAIPYAERSKFDYYWLVDPLDGTKEFIKRNGEFTVNIALIHRKKAVLGVVFVPIMVQTLHQAESMTEGGYFAVKGLGAYKLADKMEAKINCSRFKLTDKGLRIPISRSHTNVASEQFFSNLDAPILTPKGSALKLVMLAEGLFDYYPRIGLTSEWDTAAAHIIIEEAGGQMVQFDSRKPLVYNKKNLLNPNFIASGVIL